MGVGWLAMTNESMPWKKSTLQGLISGVILSSLMRPKTHAFRWAGKYSWRFFGEMGNLASFQGKNLGWWKYDSDLRPYIKFYPKQIGLPLDLKIILDLLSWWFFTLSEPMGWNSPLRKTILGGKVLSLFFPTNRISSHPSKSKSFVTSRRLSGDDEGSRRPAWGWWVEDHP